VDRSPILVDRSPIAHGRAFELPGGPDAVLLLHGLTGSTFEVYPVAERLEAAGMRCLAPLLAGHGGTPADLVGVPWTDWIAQAWRELQRLEGARRTFVVGCSMGALVGCALAHDHPERVDGLVLLAPALELQLQGKLGAFLGGFRPLRDVVIPKGAGSDVRDEEARRRNPCLAGMPLGAIAELASLQQHVDRQLPGVAAPALVIIGAHDHTVTVAGARRLARRIGSGPARTIVLPESWHLVGVDVEREAVADETLAFLDAIPVPGAARAVPARRGPRPSRHRGREALRAVGGRTGAAPAKKKKGKPRRGRSTKRR